MVVSILRLSIRKKRTLIIDGLLGNLAFIPWLQRQGRRRDHKPVTLDGFGVHVSHSQYSVVRNFVCGGHVEQKHCKATGPPEKRHPRFSASSESVASACWGASSLGCRSMGQENLQVILAAERRQKRHQSDTLSDTQTCLSKAPAHSVP